MVLSNYINIVCANIIKSILPPSHGSLKACETLRVLEVVSGVLGRRRVRLHIFALQSEFPVAIRMI